MGFMGTPPLPVQAVVPTHTNTNSIATSTITSPNSTKSSALDQAMAATLAAISLPEKTGKFLLKLLFMQLHNFTLKLLLCV